MATSLLPRSLRVFPNKETGSLSKRYGRKEEQEKVESSQLCLVRKEEALAGECRKDVD
jgi:hypothetical protein